MGAYEEEKKCEQIGLSKKILLVGIILPAGLMLRLLFWQPHDTTLIVAYAVIITTSFIFLFLIGRARNLLLLIYTFLLFYIAGILFLHLKVGMMEDFGDAAIPLIIVVATFLLGWAGGLFITTFSSGLYALLVALEYLRMIPGNRVLETPLFFQNMKVIDMSTITVGRIALWFALCAITGFLHRLIESKRREIVQRREELRLWNEELAKRVEERTRKLKATQEKMITSEKLAGISQLSIGMAHELNNPLTVILANAQLLSEEMEQSPPEKQEKAGVFVKRILDSATRCKNIVSDLLEFSGGLHEPRLKIEQGKINEILDSTLSDLNEEIKNHRAKVTKEYEEDLPRADCDITKIKGVFSNIVLNALEAMSKGGELSLTTTTDGDFVLVKVKDTGCGIPQSDMKKVFDPFFTTKEKGAGMGLAISYGNIKAHKGILEIESKEGEGTTAVVKLPLRQQ